jgi:hypothetical protein
MFSHCHCPCVCGVHVCALCLLGYCGVTGGTKVSPTTNSASGTVCDGWERPVTDLMALGLMDDVIRRLNALPAADRVVYVTGHSRGGALVGVPSETVFTSYLVHADGFSLCQMT